MLKFTAVLIILFTVACGNLDHPDHSDPFDVSEPDCPARGVYESNGIDAVILSLDAVPVRLETSSNQNAWAHVFDGDGEIIHSRYIIGDAVFDFDDQDAVVVRPHREVEWTLWVDCL